MVHTVGRASKLYDFLFDVLPKEIRRSGYAAASKVDARSYNRESFIKDVEEGIGIAPMSTRMTPHILSVIDWENAFEDPIRQQFIPLKSTSVEDHPKLKLDSLYEVHDSPVRGLVPRYPDKVLFLGIENLIRYWL